MADSDFTDDLLMPLTLPEWLRPTHSLDEIAEQKVKKWQQETLKHTRNTFARMRRYLDSRSAATAAETGDSRQAQAISKRMAKWGDQERQMVTAVQSAELADEARQWFRRQLERGKVDPAEPIPKLLAWLVAAREMSCYTADADLEKAIREAIVQDAVVIGEAKQPGGGGEAITVIEANRVAMNLAKLTPAFVGGGVRQWAAKIRQATGKTCSISTVKETRLWKETMKATGRGRTRGKPPKAVGLTENMEAVVGTGKKNEILNELIAQQENDYEPSPLDAERSEASRKPKHYKRV